jgi:hypothetical protein
MTKKKQEYVKKVSQVEQTISQIARSDPQTRDYLVKHFPSTDFRYMTHSTLDNE